MPHHEFQHVSATPAPDRFGHSRPDQVPPHAVLKKDGHNFHASGDFGPEAGGFPATMSVQQRHRLGIYTVGEANRSEVNAARAAEIASHHDLAT